MIDTNGELLKYEHLMLSHPKVVGWLASHAMVARNEFSGCIIR